MFNSSRPHGLQPTRLLRPWDFPGKSTGVGCHCLLCFSTLSPVLFFSIFSLMFERFCFLFFSLLFLPLVSCSASVSPETSPKQWPLGHLPGFPGGSAGKEFACNAGEPSSIPGSGRLCGEGNSYPFQYS